jgi:hypothetical protein
MKKIVVAAVAVLFTVMASAQQEVKIEELAQHIGDSVKVCAKIYGGIFLERSKDTPTLLNAGGAYPNNPLTIVIGPEVRKEFKNKPEEFYKDKQVCITGKVELYKEKPQIVIHTVDQLIAQ